MAKIRYEVGYTNEVTKPLTGHTLIVARVMEDELGAEPLSNKTIVGMIRIISDANRIGNYIDIDKILSELKASGFLTPVED